MTAVRRLEATANSARLAGDVQALDVLQDALSQAQRQAWALGRPTDRESIAATVLELYEVWRHGPDRPTETPEQGSIRRHPSQPEDES